MKKIRRREVTDEAWGSYIVNENRAYEELVKKGYSPQGIDKDFKNVVIFKIENQHTNNEKREIYYFENWQTANKNLK